METRPDVSFLEDQMERDLLRCFMNDEGHIAVTVTPFSRDANTTEWLARRVAEMVVWSLGEDAFREIRQQPPLPLTERMGVPLQRRTRLRVAAV
jgi:hypothetical protein